MKPKQSVQPPMTDRINHKELAREIVKAQADAKAEADTDYMQYDARRRQIFYIVIPAAYTVAVNYARKLADQAAARIANIWARDVTYQLAHHVASSACNNDLYLASWALRYHKSYEAAYRRIYDHAQITAWPDAFDAAYAIIWIAAFEAAASVPNKHAKEKAVAAADQVADEARIAAQKAADAAVGSATLNYGLKVAGVIT